MGIMHSLICHCLLLLFFDSFLLNYSINAIKSLMV